MSPRNKGPARWPEITRRDFVHGAGLALGTAALSPSLATLAATSATRYPPALTGLRGNHEGSQVYPHALRDGQGGTLPAARETGEAYDLVVVGAGISGLSAAHFYRQRFGAGARILILDNHDDFGGHAKRNEFDVDGCTLLSYGGTQAIDSPEGYRPSAKRLFRELGIDVAALARNFDVDAYPNLKSSCFFDRETFGTDRLVTGMNSRPWAEFLAEAPISEAARAELLRLYTTRKDYLPHLDRAAKERLLAKTSYADYLTKYCGAGPTTLAFLKTYPKDLYGVGIEAVSVMECYRNPDDYDSFVYPALDGLGLEPVEKEPYVYMFPDGNASIARLLVRELIPDAVPATGFADIVAARTHYDRLDTPGSPVRIRLSSPVVHTEAKGGDVAVDYVAGDGVVRVRARHCVLACYHGMIPYLCPGLPAAQQEAMHYGVKTPFLYTHVALRNWKAFAALGVRHIHAPGSYHSYTSLAFPVSNGAYRAAHDPSDPMVLFMLRSPGLPGLKRRDQYRAGRAELLATPFETIEGNIRNQLARMLGPAGFDANRDIAGITVNRWAHGYSYEYSTLDDPHWPKGMKPHEVARRRHGPIAIANADAAGSAFTDAAIDEAHRAVDELWRDAPTSRS